MEEEELGETFTLACGTLQPNIRLILSLSRFFTKATKNEEEITQAVVELAQDIHTAKERGRS